MLKESSGVKSYFETKGQISTKLSVRSSNEIESVLQSMRPVTYFLTR